VRGSLEMQVQVKPDDRVASEPSGKLSAERLPPRRASCPGSSRHSRAGHRPDRRRCHARHRQSRPTENGSAKRSRRLQAGEWDALACCRGSGAPPAEPLTRRGGQSNPRRETSSRRPIRCSDRRHNMEVIQCA
jgi:hypothetical protein